MNKSLIHTAVKKDDDFDGEHVIVSRNRSDLQRQPKTRGKQKAPTKRLTTIRFDADIIEHFKAQGKGWQTAMNNALREYIATH